MEHRDGEVKERSQISQEDRWNIDALYSNLESWEKTFQELGNPGQKPHWPALLAFKGRFQEGAELVKGFLDQSLALERGLAKLYAYAHMRHDEEVTSEQEKKAYNKILTLHYEYGQELAWVEPELLSLSDTVISDYLSSDVLQPYHFYLERILRVKPHTLSADKEELMALAGQALGVSGKTFNAFNNADLQFPPAVNSEGREQGMSHAKYILYMRDKDRELRTSAFYSMLRSFEEFENMLTELLSGKVQTSIFNRRARKYSSALESALFPNQIETRVYTNLVKTIREGLPSLHKYMQLRKKALKLDQLHMYDLYVPIVEAVDLRYSYQEAEAMVVDSVAPLGEYYQSTLHRGLTKERWVDRYENVHKRSGAYSSGCYDSMPYILLNFQGTFTDMMTLAHEAGHSMHSYLTNQNQPYHYSDYPIFLAEVASTFNEELLFHHLMKQNLSDREKAYLINQKIEDIRATFFRQTMFAEFELKIHEMGEENIPLTPGRIKEIYRALNRDFFGPDVEIDPEIDIEWARIPHFYTSFYVYQYATGISAAYALFKNVTEGGNQARDAYLGLLCSGSSGYPLDLLESAGVNMRQNRPIQEMINQFDALVEQLSTLV